MWREKCGYHVTKKYVEEQECQYWECPMENPVVDASDEMHRILGDSLASVIVPK